MVSHWGDARRGKFAENLVGFGRALRRAGVAVDSERVANAQRALMLAGVASKADVSAALEAVLISRQQDRAVFAELFDAYFRNPDVANKLLAQMLPSAEGKAEGQAKRPRVAQALSPKAAQAVATPQADQPEQTVEFDAAMTASTRERLQQADFNALSADEYQVVERLAREVSLPLPTVPSRRHRVARTGSGLHWPKLLQGLIRHDGEVLQWWRHRREHESLPLVVLLDVSGSMERYARMLLSFLHAATQRRANRAQQLRRRDVFAFGTRLTDLTPAFDQRDTDAMLDAVGRVVPDFAGGTRLGDALATLRTAHARRLVGRRSVVLLVSDGLDTGSPEALHTELRWLKRHSRSLLWLNPLLRYDAYQPLAGGAAVLHRNADTMLAVHNLQHLRALAASIATLLQQSQRNNHH